MSPKFLLVSYPNVFLVLLQWSRVLLCMHRLMEQDLDVQGTQQCIMIQSASSPVIMAI